MTMSVSESGSQVFKLPCGIVDETGQVHDEVEIREMRGWEEDILTNTKIDINRRLDQIFEYCIARIGTIVEKVKIVNLIQDLPIADRLKILYAIRIISVGEMYEFKVMCPNEECGKEISAAVNLNDLEMTEMPDKTKRLYDITLPSGKKATVKVITGRDYSKLNQLEKSIGSQMTASILTRVVKIDEEEVTVDMLRNLSLKDRNKLRAEFGNIEGSVDGDIEVDCKECGREFTTAVDTGQLSFFFQST